MEELLQAEEEGKKKKKKNPHYTTNPECARTYKVANSRTQNTTESRERRARKETRWRRGVVHEVARGKRRGGVVNEVARGKRGSRVVAWQTRLRKERKKRGSVVCVALLTRLCGDNEATKMPRKKNSKPVYMVFLCTRHVYSAHFANRVDMLIRVSSDIFDKIGTIQKRLACPCARMTRTNREMIKKIIIYMLINVILCGLAK